MLSIQIGFVTLVEFEAAALAAAYQRVQSEGPTASKAPRSESSTLHSLPPGTILASHGAQASDARDARR